MNLLLLPLAFAALTAPGAGPKSADKTPAECRAAIDKGLAYLAGRQHKDGYWVAAGDQFRVAMTGLAGTALLAEGGPGGKGKYAGNVRKAADWLVARSQKDGLLGDRKDPSEAGRYMFGQGFGVLFLSSVYQLEDDGPRRKALKDVLTRAVAFLGKAQTTRGGWGYVSAADGGDFDEGAVTITEVQALRAARLAGIDGTKEVLAKADDYLKKSTTAQGGLIYSLSSAVGGERPALTAGALAARFKPGEYQDGLAREWLKFCQAHVPLGDPEKNKAGFGEYTHLYLAQVVYGLGDDGYGKLFPDSKPSERLTWGGYRTNIFSALVSTQAKDGSWKSGSLGPVFPTACFLTILQLDAAAVPAYRR